MTFKNPEERKRYHNEYMKKWKEKNIDKWKSIQSKSDSRPERKEYLRNWHKSKKSKIIQQRFRKNHPEKQREYDRNYKLKYPEKVKAKFTRYYLSVKGIVNRLKKSDRRKFKIENKNLTCALIEMVNARDKFCPYCKLKFPDENNFKDNQYDHLDAFQPFSEINMVRCCSKCNQEKSNADVLRWCKFMEYTPAPIVFELLSKQSNVNI